jgi:hypothetical protein
MKKEKEKSPFGYQDKIIEDISYHFDKKKLRERSDSIEPNSVLYRIMEENPIGKEYLAHLYYKHVMEHESSWWKANFREDSADRNDQTNETNKPPIRRVFLESGSTLLYLAQGLRESKIVEQSRNLYSSGTSVNYPRLSLWTNNNLSSMLFLADDHGTKKRIIPYVFSGYLEPKYHGIFPFYSKESQPARDERKDVAEFKREEERIGYAQCRMDLANCDILLLAASRLSLLYGPTVGSRENAIFKNACYNACVPPLGDKSKKEIHLFITSDKLIAHSDENRAILEKLKRKDKTKIFPTFEFLEKNLEYEREKLESRTCYTAFDIHLKEVISSPFNKLWKDRDQPLSDDTKAVHLGEGRFRICQTWFDLFVKAGLTVHVFISCKGTREVAWVSNEVNWVNNQIKKGTVGTHVESCSVDDKCACGPEKKINFELIKPENSKDIFVGNRNEFSLIWLKISGDTNV